MGTQLRMLDDASRLSEGYLKQTLQHPFGTVTQAEGQTTDLRFRDMTNKILHSASHEWLLGSVDPVVICHPHDHDRWKRAEIRLLPLMAIIGGLMI